MNELNEKTLSQIAGEAKTLYQKAKDKLEQGIANYKYFFQNEAVDLNQYVLRGIL